MDSTRSRTTRFLRTPPSRRALLLLALAAAALITLWILFDWNWFKGPLERQVSAQTQRQFRIGGNLDVDLGRLTTVRAGQLRLGNAAWSKEPVMAAAEHAELDIEIWPLIFRRSVRIPEIRLVKPVLRLETGSEGKGNWIFGDDGNDGAPPIFRKIWIEQGALRFLDDKRDTDIRIDVNSLPPRSSDSAPAVALKGGGRWASNRFTVSGRAESPLELQNSDKPYRIDLRASAGATHAHARGELVDPFQLRDFDLRMALSGQNMEDLYPLFGLAIPATPPYRFDGRFRRDGQTWRYDRFSGTVGDSDLGGSAIIDTGGERLLLKADLVSKRLDFDDLGGFVGAPPQSGGGESSNDQLRAQAARAAADTRVLPNTPYDLTKLRSMDADVRLRAQRILAPSLPLDDMDAHLKLEAGLLRLEPLNFGVAGGDIRSNIRMDARKQAIQTRAQVALRGLELGKLFPDAQLTRDAVGRIGGDVAITGTGNSVAAILGSADGDIALGMGRGQISNLLMELAGLDIAEALKFLLTKDRVIPIRCAFGDFAVSDGLMRTRSLAFDSTDTIIVGEGSINLKGESLDLLLRPRPKDRSILSLRSPLVVSGTFKDPSFRPDFKRLGLRGAAALALTTIAPPAALLATIETGPGEDSGCGGSYAK
ncbi:AsmA family protein [Pseudoxanthomonas wuyuanensis]